MTNNFYIGVASMIFLGALGGVINGINTDKQISGSEILKNALTGILGALSIPLVLQLISSDLLNWVSSTTFDPKDYLVFVGFCGVGGFSATRILPALSERLAKQIQDAKDMAVNATTKTQQLENGLSEPHPDETPARTADPNQQKIITALGQSKYVYRNVPGISKDTELDENTVSSNLKEMKKQNMVGSKVDKNNNVLWYKK